MNSARPPFQRSAVVVGLFTVVAANFLYLDGLSLVLDPMLSMEPFYIEMARHPVSSILNQDPAWGPLYALWLKPMVAALGDPVAVYTANVYALSVGVSVLIYFYLLLLSRRVGVAAGTALFFLICDLNVPLYSKVSAFALMVLLAGLALAELVPAGARRMSVAAAAVLLVSYARPEVFPAALCLCLTAIWLARGESHRSGWGVLRWPAAVLASILMLALWRGTPLFSPYHGGGARLSLAFREHFAWNWSKWHGEGRDFLSIWEQEFGAAQTTLQAFAQNPGAFMHHLGDNLLGTVSFIAASTFNHYPLLAPATTPFLVRAESILVSAAVFAGLILIAVRRGWRRQLLDSYGQTLFTYLIVSACGLASATAVFPLAHYLLIPGIVLMLMAALATALILPVWLDTSWRQHVLAGLLCLIAIPRPFVLPSAYVVPGSPFKGGITVARTVRDSIELIRSLRLPAPVHVLTVTDGMGEMLGAGFREIKIWQRGTQPLEAYLRDNDVGVIVNLDGGQDTFADNDPYWKVIHYDPNQAGFTRLSVPNHGAVRIYVRTDLMRKPGETGLGESAPPTDDQNPSKGR